MRSLFAIGLAAALSLSSSPTLKQDRLATFQRENVLGTSFEMKVGAPNAQIATHSWKAAAASGRQPSRAELANAVAAMRVAHWKLDPATHTATHLDTAPLAMNSFVKSYIMERAVNAAMHTAGVTAVVLNI